MSNRSRSLWLYPLRLSTHNRGGYGNRESPPRASAPPFIISIGVDGTEAGLQLRLIAMAFFGPLRDDDSELAVVLDKSPWAAVARSSSQDIERETLGVQKCHVEGSKHGRYLASEA